jgi:hypothetical protein
VHGLDRSATVTGMYNRWLHANKSLATNLMQQTYRPGSNHQGIYKGYNLICLLIVYLFMVNMQIIFDWVSGFFLFNYDLEILGTGLILLKIMSG